MDFTVRNGECNLYCEKLGEGPLLVLIHGVVCDSDYFRAAAEYLSRNFTVVTYDRRGYTRSKCSADSDWSVRAQSEDAAAVIRACGSDSAFVVGCSAGGIIALELARSRPEFVRALMLHEPPVGNTPEYRAELKAWLFELRECAEKRRTAKAMMSFVNRLGGIDPRAPKRSLEEQKRDIMTMPVFLHHEMESFLQYLPEGLERIELKMPCTIAMGESDPEGLFHMACEPAAKMLGAKLLHVPGYHNFAADLPYDFAVAVTGVMFN